MRVQPVDPPAYTPPYDRALAGALAAAGADVELLTSRALYGDPAPPDGFALREHFYRRATAGERGAAARRLWRAAEHLPGMLRARRPDADVVHYQWLTAEPVDAFLLARGVPRVFTAHNVLRRDAGRMHQLGARALAGRVDALIAHTQAGARELVDRYGAAAERVHVIPHGAFEHLTRQPREAPLPDELAAVEGPVILSFGIVRPYKGIDVLLEAFAGLEGAELWIVGRPLMDTAPLRAAAELAGGTVRFVERFVTDAELPAYFRRADVVALPYRRIDQSGVLYTALAFGKAMVLSDVGGFGELAREHKAARLVRPEDPAALRAALQGVIDDPGQRTELERNAQAAASGPYSWTTIAKTTLELYSALSTQHSALRSPLHHST
jgi:glycosyltransferase involved in cell wall biosynthesis